MAVFAVSAIRVKTREKDDTKESVTINHKLGETKLGKTRKKLMKNTNVYKKTKRSYIWIVTGICS